MRVILHVGKRHAAEAGDNLRRAGLERLRLQRLVMRSQYGRIPLNFGARSGRLRRHNEEER
jgi:hypothetical protein